MRRYLDMYGMDEYVSLHCKHRISYTDLLSISVRVIRAHFSVGHGRLTSSACKLDTGKCKIRAQVTTL